MIITLPTCVTLIRIILIPFIVLQLIKTAWMYALILLVSAALTDALDGALARYLNQESYLGAMLDAFADKCLLMSCYSALIYGNIQTNILPHWFLALALIRECTILMGSSLYALYRPSVRLKPCLLGKLSMASQLLCLSMGLWQASNTSPIFLQIFTIMVIIATIFIISSWIYYIKQGITLWNRSK